MPDEATEVKEEQEVQEPENAGSEIDIDGIKVTPEKARELFGAEIDRQNGRMKKLVEETEARLARIEQEKEELAKKLMSEEEVKNFEISKREKEIAEREKRIKQTETELAISESITEYNLTNEAKEFLFADAPDVIREKAERLKKYVEKYVKAEIENVLKNGNTAPVQSAKNPAMITQTDFKNLDTHARIEFINSGGVVQE